MQGMQSVDRTDKSAFERYDTLIAYILASISAILVLSYWSVHNGMFADDAYIHMRIARNFVEHGQPFFNLNEPVSGSSSHLWLWLVSGLFWLFGPSEQLILNISVLINLIFLWSLIIVFRQSYSFSLSVVLAFLVNLVFVLDVSISAMESALVLSILCWTVIALSKEKFYLAALLAGFCMLGRYEYIVWVALVSALILFQYKRFKPLLILTIPGGLLVLFQYGFYGSVISNTVKAKSIVYDVHIFNVFEMAKIYPSYSMLAIFTLLGLFAGVYTLQKHKNSFPLLFVVMGLTLLILYIARNTFIFSWYRPLYFAPLAIGLLLLLRQKNFLISGVVLITMLFFFSTSLSNAYSNINYLLKQEKQEDVWISRMRHYRHAAQNLAQSQPQATIMATEIGIISWIFPGQIIDAVGLVSPQVLQYHPLSIPEQRSNGSYAAVPVAAVQAFEPDFIISMDMLAEELRKTLEQGDALPYREERVYTTDMIEQAPDPLTKLFRVRIYAREVN